MTYHNKVQYVFALTCTFAMVLSINAGGDLLFPAKPAATISAINVATLTSAYTPRGKGSIRAVLPRSPSL